MALNERIYLRVPAQLKYNWQRLVPTHYASRLLRVFMQRAIEAARENPKQLHKLIRGMYQLRFD